MKRNKLILVALLMLPQILFSYFSYGQIQMVKGKVTDENNSPIVGVNVIIQGTNNGTVTNFKGDYQIEASKESTLTFSFVGYDSKEKQVGDLSIINVILIEDYTELEDVIVVGYGTQRRQDLTGSVSSLKADKLESKAVSSIESALQGEVPGISVVNSGGPGTSPTVRIRGIGSVNFSSDPLYVIDGVPVGSLNNFDIKNMESVTVLKDAASAAIYGSRAANGVVLITTKRGSRNGKMTLSVDASTGFQQAWNTLDLMNRSEYIKFGTDLLTNAGLELPYRFSNMTESIYEGSNQTYAQTETNWQDEMFRTAPMSQINVDISGGNEKYRLYTSYGKYTQEGIMLGTNYNRHSFRINTESYLNKFITVGEKIKASYSETLNEKSSGGRTLLKHIVNQVPYIPVEDPTLAGGYRSSNANDGTDPENPVRISMMDKNQNNIVNLVGNVFAEIKFADWLKFRSSVGMEYTANRNIIQNPIYSDGFNQRVDNELTDNRSTYYSQIITNQLTFDRSFGDHYINAVAVVEQQTTQYTNLNGSGRQSTNDLNQLAGSSSQSIDGTLSETALLSYAGRLNYSFADKYLLSASIRRDGSSVFAPGKKWGYFPGGSIGWIVSKENFLKDADMLSNLKLRASYGTLGFNAVGAYPWQSSIYTNTTAVFNNTEFIGAYFNKLPNEDLEWEITTMTNIGFDLGLMDNSITFSAEYYIRMVDNLIVNNPLPTSMGYAQNPVANVGSMKNWGYDFNLGYNKIEGEFQYSVTANMSFINNEVLSLSVGAPSIEMGGETSDYGGYNITRTEKGYPIQGFYGWKTDGLFQSQSEIDALDSKTDEGVSYQTAETKPGDIKFQDLDDNGIIDDEDRTYIGNYLPDFSYGVNFSANYKGFDVSLFLQGVYGNEIYNGTKVITQGMMRLFNQDKAVLNAWTSSNTNTDIPRAISGDPNHNTRTSDRFIEDGSYLRIKNLSVGYSFSKDIMPQWFNNTFSGLRLYVTGQNLLTFTKYTGYDPEIASRDNNTLTNGVDFGQYPQPRTFIFGVKASF